MAIVPFGQWLPDQADYVNAGATVAKNVIPRTASSYGPLAGLSAVSNALTNRPQGAGSFRDSAGTVFTFTGDDENLFKFNTGTLNFDEISSSTDAYTVATDEHVIFRQFGDRVISVNGHTDQPQSYVMGTSSDFATLAGAAPRAKTMGIVKDFVMMGNTWDSTDNAVVNRVWWSAINDPTDWPTIGSTDAANKQSDRQDLPVGGQVQAIVGPVGGLDAAVFLENAIYRVQYEGPPTVLGFYLVEADRGTPAPNSVISIGTHAFYLSEDGFYQFTGSGSTAIGVDRVDKWFFSELNQTYYHRIYGSADAINKLAFWAFPSTESTNGVPDTILIYNWAVDRWAYANVDLEYLFRDLTSGYTLEGLDSVSGSIDALQFSLDSRGWLGGRLVLSAFDTDKKLSRFNGNNLAAVVETAETGGSALTLVNGVRPFVDGGTLTVGIKTRDLLTASTPLTGPYAIDSNGQANFSKSARYGRAQVNVAAAGSWTHAQGIEYDATPAGVV